MREVIIFAMDVISFEFLDTSPDGDPFAILELQTPSHDVPELHKFDLEAPKL